VCGGGGVPVEYNRWRRSFHLGQALEGDRGGLDVHDAVLEPALPLGVRNGVLHHALEEVEQVGLPLRLQTQHAVQEPPHVVLVRVRDLANPNRSPIVL